MKQTIFIIIFFLILFPQLFSQSTENDLYYPGYVIDKDGNKVAGLILYKDHNFNRKICQFKNTPESDVISYSPDQIREYKVEGITHFKSAEIEEKWEVSLVFVEYIMEGNPSLLNYKNRLFVEGIAGFEELKKLVEDTVKIGTRVTVQGREQYKQALYSSMNQCPEMAAKILETRYHVKKFLELFTQYYECTDQTYTAYTTNEELGKLRLGASLTVQGMNLGLKSFTNVYMFEDAKAAFDFAIKPRFFIDFSMPSRIRNLSYRAGISYLRFNYVFKGESERSGGNLFYELPVKMDVLEFPQYVTYTFNSDPRSLYLLGGMNVGVPLRASSERRAISNSGTILSQNGFKHLDIFASLVAGLGIKSDKGEKTIFGELTF
ncbi:MAG: outer membrane beta-barrel protein, partial [Bacteroidetes bacterium]|nr:outer membrane beta-barrel protein [Bacteroidota bacterium]